MTDTETHSDHYVTTAAGTYRRFLRDDSAFAVSAATLAIVARDIEDSSYWHQLACELGMVFW